MKNLSVIEIHEFKNDDFMNSKHYENVEQIGNLIRKFVQLITGFWLLKIQLRVRIKSLYLVIGLLFRCKIRQNWTPLFLTGL